MQSMKILSVPLLIQPLPSPLLLPLSSEYIGLFLLHLVTMWELQKANSLLICGRRWDRVPKVFPLHLVRQQSVPRGSLQGFVCPSGGGMAGGSFARQQWRNTRELKVLGEAIKTGKKPYGVVWDTMVWIQGKKKEQDLLGEEKVWGETSHLTVGDRKCWQINWQMWLCHGQVLLSRSNYQMQQWKFSHFTVCMTSAFDVLFSLNINIISLCRIIYGSCCKFWSVLEHLFLDGNCYQISWTISLPRTETPKSILLCHSEQSSSIYRLILKFSVTGSFRIRIASA